MDEKWTEAAAATGMIAMMRLGPMPVLVHADHPILLFIRHNGQTLFGAWFTEPHQFASPFFILINWNKN